MAEETESKEISIDQPGFDIEVEIRGKKRHCIGRCGKPGKWRFCTRNFVCDECRHKRPHKLITRSKAKQDYNVSFDDLHRGFKAGLLRMMTVRNPHGPGNPPMRLYYDHEVCVYAEEQRKMRSKKAS